MGATHTLSTYFSSPPALSFWWVELGPQVRPFFLLLVRSSFLHTALRPQVLLPSVGVTELQGQKPREPGADAECFVCVSDARSYIGWLVTGE